MSTPNRQIIDTERIGHLLNTRQVMEKFHIGRTLLNHLTNDGKVPVHRLTSATGTERFERYYDAKELKAALAEQEAQEQAKAETKAKAPKATPATNGSVAGYDTERVVKALEGLQATQEALQSTQAETNNLLRDIGRLLVNQLEKREATS